MSIILLTVNNLLRKWQRTLHFGTYPTDQKSVSHGKITKLNFHKTFQSYCVWSCSYSIKHFDT